MGSEFKSFLRTVGGGVALAFLFSYFTFVAPNADRDTSGKNLDTVSSEAKSKKSLARSANVESSKRLPASSLEGPNTFAGTPTGPGSMTNVGARVSSGDFSVGQADQVVNGELNSNNSNAFQLENVSGGIATSSGRASGGSGASAATIANTFAEVDSSNSSAGTNKEDELGVATTSSIFSKSNEQTQTTTSTTSTTSTSSNTDEEQESVTPISCSVDQAEGVYSSAISVTITCSESATISYCLLTGGGFCDPVSSPTIYSAPVALNLGDGVYGLSFFADANLSSSSTTVADYTYTIDSTPPNMIVNFDKVVAQTTQVPLANYTQSTDFGNPNYFYHQINFKGNNPGTGGFGWTCDQVLSDYSTVVSPAPVTISANFDVSGLNPVSDQIDQLIGLSDFAIGDNYIATIIEDRTMGIVSCQIQNVVVQDFVIAAFTGTGQTPVTAGVRTTLGSFVSFGHYQAVPNTTTSGQLSNGQGATSAKQGLYTLTH